MTERGRFIAIYGSNNLGKTTQTKMLVSALQDFFGQTATYVKYPIYTLPPTGPVINNVLRNGRAMGEEEFQRLCAQNRRDFEPTLDEMLERGLWVVGEDYIGTGESWGITNGLTVEQVEEINRWLLKPDLEILLDGQRFTSGIERGHRHEGGGKWERNREVFRMLAERYCWPIVEAARSKEEVHKDIVWIVKERFSLKK